MAARACRADMAFVRVYGRATPDRAGARPYVRLRVRTNRGVEVPIGQNTGCP